MSQRLLPQSLAIVGNALPSGMKIIAVIVIAAGMK